MGPLPTLRIAPVLALVLGAAAAQERPDLVVVHAPSVDGPALASTPTPELDRLAASGLTLTECYDAGSPAATRRALLTGRYPQRGAPDEERWVKRATLVAALRRHGYRTAVVGAWNDDEPLFAVAGITAEAVKFLRAGDDRPALLCAAYPARMPGEIVDPADGIDSAIGEIAGALVDAQRDAIIVFVGGSGRTDDPRSAGTAPCIVWAGSRSEETAAATPTHVTDVAQTLVKLTGAEIGPVRPLDGADLAPALRGEQLEFERVLFREHDGARIARGPRFKLIDDGRGWTVHEPRATGSGDPRDERRRQRRAHALEALYNVWARRTGVVAPDLPPAREEYHGRRIAQTMHWRGASWLFRETREREEHASRMLDALGVKPGQVICDLGCGNGYHTLRLARRVGPDGLVYGVDIQPQMLRMLRRRQEQAGLTNVVRVLGALDDPLLAPGSCDLILMVDVYHELSHPERTLAAIRRALAPGGRLVLVEFRSEDPDVPIKELHKMSKAQIRRELEPNGFELVEEFDELPWQHVMFFAAASGR